MHIDGVEPRARPGGWITRDFVAISSALFVSATGAMAFVQFLVPYLTSVKGLSTEEASVLLAVAFAVAGLGRFAYPAVQRRIGDRGVLLLGHVFLTAYPALLVVAHGAPSVAAAVVLFGAGGAMVFSAGPLQILDATPRRWHGRASGWFFATNFLAWALGVLLLGTVAQGIGLHAVPAVASALAAAGLATIAVVPAHRDVRRESGGWAPIRWALMPGPRTILVLMAASSIAFGLMFVTVTAIATARLGPGVATLVIALFYVARLPGSVLAGIVVDRVGPSRLLFGAFWAAAVTLVAVPLTDGAPILMLAVIVLGLQQAAVPVAAMASAERWAPTGASHLTYTPFFAALELGVAVTVLTGQIVTTVAGNDGTVLVLFGIVYGLAGVLALVALAPPREHTTMTGPVP